MTERRSPSADLAPACPDFAMSRLLAIAAMIASAACWGLATVMSKGALHYLPSFTLLALQLVGCALVIGAVARAARWAANESDSTNSRGE